MQIEIQIDPSCKELKLILLAPAMNEEVQALLSRLQEARPQMLAGFAGDVLEVLALQDISRVWAQQGKVYAVANAKQYTLRLRLYELEQRLDPACFVRISNSEIVNIKQVKSFDLSFTGTICVALVDGTVTYVSRRYVSKIKQALGV